MYKLFLFYTNFLQADIERIELKGIDRRSIGDERMNNVSLERNDTAFCVDVEHENWHMFYGTHLLQYEYKVHLTLTKLIRDRNILVYKVYYFYI